MGRRPRIEYEGAVYHVMGRGNHQEAVFLDSRDNRMFLDTLGEACGRTGWVVHAYVLMGNHYHLLLETPEANLVDGMRWLQGTYTKRFNIRHDKGGHLFQGRYKSLIIEPEGYYFNAVESYVHLNPVRVKGYDFEMQKLSDYPWSSYPLYLRASLRPEWMSVERTLGNYGLHDDRSGRDLYRKHMSKRVIEISCSETPWEADDQWAKIRTGWCFGGEGFRADMVEALDSVMKGKRRDSFAGEGACKHDILEAERLVCEGMGRLGLHDFQLAELKKSDPLKMAVAWLVRRNTIVRNEWISKRLCMGRPSKMSCFIKQVEDANSGILFEAKKRLKNRTDT